MRRFVFVTRSFEQKPDVGERLRRRPRRNPRATHGTAGVPVGPVARHADVVPAGEHDGVVVVGPHGWDARAAAHPARDRGVYGPDQRLRLGGVRVRVTRGLLACESRVSRNCVWMCAARAHGAVRLFLYTLR